MMTSVGSEAQGWAARLELEVVRDGERSRLARRSHFGPLRIQRPFYPEGDSPVHVYLLHPPGGMVGGDQLESVVKVRARASLLVTTPAAQKLYRSLGQTSLQTQLLSVEADGSLEWFPCETLVFDGARARVNTRVELAGDATFIGWDLGCFGRPASDLGFSRGELRQGFEIFRAGEPLIVDRSHVTGNCETLSAAWGYAGEPVYGTLYCVAGKAADLDALAREVRALLGAGSVRAAVTSFDGTLVVRALGREVERVRAALVAAWRVARPCLLGRQALPPRIWAT
ncbi:MAG TPA: urease accessory protein UreD [Polyangiaceae bacterium]|nr:urease accessory protein UreD [Polyangiaceae bacterium]